jgi:Tol biopolymer transport system component
VIIVRVLAAVAKPVLLTGALTASVAGGWLAYDRLGPDPAVTPFERVQSAGQRLLISEFGDTTDMIVAVDPDDAASGRTQIATIDHAPGYGVFPVLSPDGQAIAYTALAPDEPRPAPDVPAHAAIIDVGGDVTPLADDVDLLVPPVWSPDSASIVVRKNTAAPADDDSGGAGSFDLLLLGRDGSRTTLSSWQSASVFPIAFVPDGSKLYFATLNNDGTNLYSVGADGTGETNIAHLSDQIARDWKLSPDGAKLAYSVAGSGQTPAVVAMTFDFATGTAGEAVAPAGLEAGPPGAGTARGEFNPEWRNDGALAIASLKLDGGSDALALDASGTASNLATNGEGIDLPLGWSPDGETLVVRALDGRTPFDASTSHVELLRDGGRVRVSDSADILIVGWLP